VLASRTGREGWLLNRDVSFAVLARPTLMDCWMERIVRVCCLGSGEARREEHCGRREEAIKVVDWRRHGIRGCIVEVCYVVLWYEVVVVDIEVV
jgi:hypothetical protein